MLLMCQYAHLFPQTSFLTPACPPAVVSSNMKPSGCYRIQPALPATCYPLKPGGFLRAAYLPPWPNDVGVRPVVYVHHFIIPGRATFLQGQAHPGLFLTLYTRAGCKTTSSFFDTEPPARLYVYTSTQHAMATMNISEC